MVRKIRAKLVLQLRAEGLSGRAIAFSQGMSRKSVRAVFEAADGAGIGWDEVAELEDEQVNARLFPGRGEHESVFGQPDWEQVHREMARVGVTLKLLHGEYLDATAAAGDPAMGYDRFCRTYQRHVLVTGASSRVGHEAGQSVEVDWSGPTMELINAVTGEVSKAFLFVGCLPFSRYAFCWPALDMRKESWLRAHVAMFESSSFSLSSSDVGFAGSQPAKSWPSTAAEALTTHDRPQAARTLTRCANWARAPWCSRDARGPNRRAEPGRVAL